MFTPPQTLRRVHVEPRTEPRKVMNTPSSDAENHPLASGSSVPGGDSNRLVRFETLAEIERKAICAALENCGGSPALAAKQLEISTATIYRKIKIYQRG